MYTIISPPSVTYLLMIFDGLLVVAKEVVCVAKVTNCPALCLLISKFTDQFQVCPERERERDEGAL